MKHCSDIFSKPDKFMNWITKQDKVNIYLSAVLTMAIATVLQRLYEVNVLTEFEVGTAVFLSFSLVSAFLMPYIKVWSTHLGLLILKVNNFNKVFSSSVTGFTVIQLYSIVVYFVLFLSQASLEVRSISIIAHLVLLVGFVHGYLLEIVGLKQSLKISWNKAVIAPFLIGIIIAVIVFMAIIVLFAVLGSTMPYLNLANV